MVRKVFHHLRKFTESLRFKLSFYTGLVAFLSITAFAYQSISTQETSLIRARVASVLKYTEVIKAAIWNGMMTKDRRVVREIVDAVGQDDAFEQISIYDRKGVLHYASNPDMKGRIGSTFKPEEAAHLLGNIQEDTSVRYEYLRGQDVVVVANPLVNSKSCSTNPCHAHPERQIVLGLLLVKLKLKGLRSELKTSAHRILWFALFLFVLLSTVIGLGVIFMISRPLERLREKAHRISGGDYVADAPANGSDSISELSRSLDDMSRQIAERERKIDATSRMYKELFEKVPCYLTVISRDYRIVKANYAYTSAFGNRIGQYCFSALKGGEVKCPNCLVEKTFQDGLTHRTNEVWDLPNVEKKAHVIVQTAPVRDEQGAIREVMEMAVDVTLLLRLQEELKKKEEQFRTLFDNVPCYLTVVDSDFRIGFYNQMFRDDFGSNWGEKCFKAYKNRTEKCERCPVEKTFQDGDSHSSEETWHHEGQDQHIVVRTSPIKDASGKVVAVMEMCTNVTELKTMENQLAILGETVAGTSHAIKNILSGLEGGVYIVDSGIRANDQGRMSTGWTMVKKNVGKISELVKDILYAARPRKPELKMVDPATLCSEVSDLFQQKAKGQEIRLVKDCPGTMGQGLLDPEGIHTVLSNLVSNAIAACEDAQGADRQIMLKGRVEDSSLIIEVHDNGQGMCDEVKQNLFKKFFSTKGSKGTGLGLLVTRKIVEENGGTITLDSQLGVGTTFIVRLPFRRVAPADTHTDSPKRLAPGGETAEKILNDTNQGEDES